MKFSYKTKGVCCAQMDIDIEDNKINELIITGGCPGNSQGMSRIVQGMDIDEVIKRLEGIPCRNKGTSCPDQLATALKLYKEEAAK